MTFPVKGPRIEEAPECGVRAETMIATRAGHTELLAYFDADRASNDPRLLLAHSASLAIRTTHGQKTRPRFVTESQFCCDNCRSINARRL
jgi:hypothetical protein